MTETVVLKIVLTVFLCAFGYWPLWQCWHLFKDAKSTFEVYKKIESGELRVYPPLFYYNTFPRLAKNLFQLQSETFLQFQVKIIRIGILVLTIAVSFSFPILWLLPTSFFGG